MSKPIPESVYISRIESAIEGKAEFLGWSGLFCGTKSRIRRRCLIDGFEWDSPLKSLWNGSGCPRCAATCRGKGLMAGESSQLERLGVISGGAYTFRRIGEYVGSAGTRYLCTCANDSHEWESSLANLLRGRGCPRCANKHPRTIDEYRERIELSISGSGIDFLGLSGCFKGNQTIGLFSCSRGTRYAQIISSTLSGARCRCCNSYTEQGMIERFNSFDGVKFVSWVGGFSGVKSKAVLIGVCGHEWAAEIGNVKTGSRCPSCAESGYNPGKTGHLYVMRSECDSRVKVGITNKPDQRMGQLKRATPFSFSRIAMVSCEDGAKIAQLEKDLHARMTRVDFGGETFDGYTEWMEWDPALLDWLEDFNRSLVS